MKFTYKSITLSAYERPDEHLNAFAHDGWRVVSAVSVWLSEAFILYVLEREVHVDGDLDGS